MGLFDRLRRFSTTESLGTRVEDARRDQERRDEARQSRDQRRRAATLPKQFRSEVKRVNKILGLRPQTVEFLDADVLAGETLFRAKVTLEDGAVFEIDSDVTGEFVTQSALSVDGRVIGRFSRTYAGDIVMPSIEEVQPDLAQTLAKQLARPALTEIAGASPVKAVESPGPRAEL